MPAVTIPPIVLAQAQDMANTEGRAHVVYREANGWVITPDGRPNEPYAAVVYPLRRRNRWPYLDRGGFAGGR